MSDITCKRFFVSGRVQGVFYRSTARARARELGVTGYARNLSDGRVEVLAVGAPDAVEALGRWLWDGPIGAQVTDVQSEPLPVGLDFQIPASFSTS